MMNSRQRVMHALNHQEPDRVPFDCTFGYEAYTKLANFLGFQTESEILPSGPGLTVSPPVEFLKEMNIDLVYVGLGSATEAEPFDHQASQYVDEWGVTWERIEGDLTAYYEVRHPPLAEATLGDIERYPWPDPTDPARTAGLAAKCQRLYEQTELAIAGRFSSSIFEQAFLMRGFEQFLVDIALDPALAGALLDKTTQVAIGLLESGMRTAGQYIQILRLAGDDMGHQKGTLLSPHAFRQMIKPRFSRLYQTAGRLIEEINPAIKLMAHTDGDVYALIPEYIELGLDVLNPVQPHVTNMDHERLKAEFGDRLAFHAGIDIQRLLPFGSPEEVRRSALETMRILGRGGGYILAPTHYLQADVPPENVLALRQAVLEGGWYTN